tara:strand:+ start:19 stop:594 length:576 start_codon:yes stop_codon:yes gene_type:complete
MASTAAAFGLKPVNLIGGQPFAGSTRQIKIASGYGTNIFNGDVVKLVAAGTVEKDTGTTTATPVGVFVGCTFTDPNSEQLTFKNYWPASTVASDAFAYVVDDPDCLFHIQADGAVAQTALGANFAIVQGSGSTSTGVSGVSLDASTVATTNTLPLRLIDFWNGPESSIGDAYTDCIVKWNAGHQYANTTGV